MVGFAERLERLCRRYGDGELDGLSGDALAALARVLEMVRGGGAEEAMLADLDLIEAAATGGVVTRGGGIPDRVTRGFRPVPGTSAHPVMHAWVCPQGTCSRRVIEYLPGRDEPDPCWITGQQLERVRLRT